MVRTLAHKRTAHPLTRPVAMKVVRPTGPVAIGGRNRHRPAWWMLYGIVLLTGAGLLAAELLLPEGLARALAELLAVFGCVALIRLWVGCNRWRLAQTERQGGAVIRAQAADTVSVQKVG